ncbi:MAG: hypothetical protein LBS63_04680 [Prevotellaceae bacterium]|jgi:hypothetical protein|nr:hypothetical protein [Prevotellaceae bacterium]
MKNRQKKKPAAGKPQARAAAKKPMRWTAFFVKLAVIFAAVVLVVIYTDHKGYFVADPSNNHIDRKWKSFYTFTKTRNADVILLGNSHVVTGVEPYILSDALGCSCFILAQSGVNIKDCWFQLSEALEHTEPKLVIIETFSIDGNEAFEENIVPLTQSFEAHKDVARKLLAMPAMFRADSWVQAWSPTIRNHSFLLTDTARIRFNRKNPARPQPYKLDLGRFARFTSGLTDSTIALYDSLGAPSKGAAFHVSEYAEKYLKKVMSLCEERNIPVLFLTVPMYYKHVDRYDAWQATMGEALQKYPNAAWLDLQQPYDTLLFTKEAFENTYESNQHLSNLGMTYVAYKLAAYVHENYELPDRSKEAAWIADFKSTDHFVFNQNVAAGTKDWVAIVRDLALGALHIRELLVKEVEGANQLIIKIDNNPSLLSSIQVVLELEHQNQRITAPIEMFPFKEVFPPSHKVYTANLRKDVKVLGVVSLK